MLPAPNRMRHGTEFSSAVRRGRRAGRASVVLHLGASDPSAAPRVGFVVPKSVGTAVVRNRVKRQLRHVMRDRVTDLPGGALLVVRALPAASGHPHLEKDVDSALASVLRVRS